MRVQLRGRRTVKTEPLPTVLSTPRSPECTLTIDFAMLRPRPLPGGSFWHEPLKRENLSKTFGSHSFGIPMPVSETEISAFFPSRLIRMRISPLGGVYLIAFEIRL